MKILALDIATTCGWAQLDGGAVAFGVDKFASGKKVHPGQRYVDFYARLVELGFHASVIAYEDVKRHAGTIAAHVYGGFVAQLKVYAMQTGKRLYPVGVGTIKKHATGKGNASKQMMMDAAAANWDAYEPSEDKGANAADALWLLDYAAQHLANEKKALDHPSPS